MVGLVHWRSNPRAAIYIMQATAAVRQGSPAPGRGHRVHPGTSMTWILCRTCCRGEVTMRALISSFVPGAWSAGRGHRVHPERAVGSQNMGQSLDRVRQLQLRFPHGGAFRLPKCNRVWGCGEGRAGNRVCVERGRC